MEPSKKQLRELDRISDEIAKDKARRHVKRLPAKKRKPNLSGILKALTELHGESQS